MSTTVTSYPTSYTTSGSISGTKYKNAIGKGADTSAVSGNDYASGSSSSKAYIYYSFEFDIPEVATIESCTCQVKGHLENASRSTAQLDIMCGSTSKANSKFTSTSAQTITLNASSMTAAEANEVQLMFTIGYYGGLVNGATMTIVYSINLTKYTITSSATGVEINPSGNTEVYEGEDYVLWIDGEDNITVTDNGTDVTSQLVQHDKPTGGSVTSHPETATTSGSVNGSTYNDCIGKGTDNTVSGSDYASSGSNAHIDYSFDFSSIPENATISSVTVKVKGHCEDSSNSSEVATLQLYSGNTAKGSESEFTTESDSTITMTAGTWTRAELQDAKLRFTIGYYGGAVSGVDWTVVYSVPITGNTTYYEYTIANVTAAHTVVVAIGSSAKMYIRLNGSWVEAATVYKKVNGSWVEQNDLTNVFESGVSYKYNG